MTGGPPPQPRSRRGPRPETDDANDPSTARHECRPWAAADEIQQAGFVILSRDDRFIDRAGIRTSGG